MSPSFSQKFVRWSDGNIFAEKWTDFFCFATRHRKKQHFPFFSHTRLSDGATKFVDKICPKNTHPRKVSPTKMGSIAPIFSQMERHGQNLPLIFIKFVSNPQKFSEKNGHRFPFLLTQKCLRWSDGRELTEKWAKYPPYLIQTPQRIQKSRVPVLGADNDG